MVVLGGMLRDRQPEAAAFGVRAFDAEKPVEHARQQLGGNARTAVDDLDRHRAGIVVERDVDDAAGGV